MSLIKVWIFKFKTAPQEIKDFDSSPIKHLLCCVINIVIFSFDNGHYGKQMPPMIWLVFHQKSYLNKILKYFLCIKKVTIKPQEYKKKIP